MNSVWKRLQRVNKHAARFQFSISYQQLTLETTPKWVPNKISIVWMRKSRRVLSQPMRWEPTLDQPLKGIILWTIPESQQITITLFKDSRSNELEDKYWSFIIEDISVSGKRRRIAINRLNMRNYANFELRKHRIELDFIPLTKKISSARLECTLACVFLKEGKATDEDMQSLASLMSINNNDIAYLNDLEDEDILSNNESSSNKIFDSNLSDVTNQLQNLTNSLSNTDILKTPVCEFKENEKTPILVRKDVPNWPKIPRPKPTDFTSNYSTSDLYSELCTQQLNKLALNNESTWPLVDSLEEKETNIIVDVDKIQTSTPSKPKPKSELKLDLEKVSNTKIDVNKLSTPGQDLLEWCQEVLNDYPNVKVTNLTTSWRNGIAFCALIHKFQPILIPNFENLSSHNIRENCRIAFSAGEALGIPKVIEPTDMDMLAIPDKLAVMTYLFQLRAHFTGHQFEVYQIGKTSEESSYTIGEFNTDTDTDLSKQLFEQEILNLRHSQSNRNLINEHNNETDLNNEENPCLILSNNHNEIMNCIQNHVNGNKSTSSSSPSDDQCNGFVDNKIPLKSYILNRHDELKEKAKVLIEQAKKVKSPPNTPVSDEERHNLLRKKARKIIAETRKNSLKSPTESISRLSNTNLNDNHYLNSKNINDNLETNGNIYENPLLMNEDSSNNMKTKDVNKYIEIEYEALDREQNAIDEQAVALEMKLRSVMDEDLADPDVEGALMSQWFNLVNKKNALIRRQMQLNLLEKEEDLEKKYEMLNNELRSILSIDDCKKSEEQKRREALLLDELVQIVNKRNELVHHIDSNEKGIEDDDLIEHDLSQIELQRRQNCIIQ